MSCHDAHRLETYPPPYPDGWYVMARSSEVGSSPVSLTAFGRRFVAFRGEDGAVSILDSACPHLGADLADGQVREGCIVCPFHKWAFRPDGAVDDIPYSDRKPKKPIARSWHVEELYGLIYLYWSALADRRAPAPVPPYPLPRYPDIESGQLTWRGRHDPAGARMHLVELAENSVDTCHFDVLHGDMRLPWGRIKVPGVRIHHAATWEPDPADGHVAWFKNHIEIELLGKIRPTLAADASVRFIGPGGIVVFTITLERLGRVVLFHSHTPEEPLLQKVRFHWFADRKIPSIVANYVAWNWISQWREDVRIWERKVFQDKPVLAREDGPIHALRRWYRQFYPDSSSQPELTLLRRTAP